MSNGGEEPSTLRTVDYRNPQPDPKPPPLDYARYAIGSTPSPNPLAAFSVMLAFFNVLWIALGISLMFKRDLEGVAWFLPPGVVISSLSGFLMARGARHDSLRVAGLFLNAGCFLISASVLGLAILIQ